MILQYDKITVGSKSSPEPEEANHSEKTPTRNIVSHFTNDRQASILLMMCQVMTRGLNGFLTQPEHCFTLALRHLSLPND